ncbi:MAG: GAF domain-containing protein [Proteobacteria bacterium]|nr:GAF domain-containing protein [Desulfobacula sp.]MBU4130266.1 GAF domain-containing protein [Pseudomonadota bacterium]
MEASINLEIHEKILFKWQKIVDLASSLLGIPASMIMRIDKEDLEVVVASSNKDNPYISGERTPFLNSGIYCERVIKTKAPLIVENAEDHAKSDQPFTVKKEMVSYLGLPILYPDKQPFGTICVQDNKENHFSKEHIDLMESLRDVIQSNVELIHMNAALGEKNKTLSEFIDEMRILRGILPICSGCKKIRNSSGNWEMMETYIEKKTEASFSHSICPLCTEELYGHKDWYKKMKAEEKG